MFAIKYLFNSKKHLGLRGGGGGEGVEVMMNKMKQIRILVQRNVNDRIKNFQNAQH